MLEIVIITATMFILFASFAEGIEWQERYIANTYQEQEKLNRIWHWLQLFERIFGVLFGVSVGIFSGLSWLSAKIIFIAAVLFWIIYDAVINHYAARALFSPSKFSTSWFEKLYFLKPILLIIAILLILSGCSQYKVIETVKIDTLKVASPILEDTLEAKVVTDTVIIANSIVKTDTIIDVRYYPLEKKFYVKAKPDTVTIIRTGKEVIYQDKSADRFYKWNIALTFLIIVIMLIIIIKWRQK